VSSIIREADSGYVYQLVDLANEARQKDCHLQALLNTREIAVSSLNWAITPAIPHEGYVPTDRDREVAFFVESALKGADGNGERSRSFTDLLTHLAGGIYFGYAVSEVNYELSDGYVVPSGFTPVSPRRFRFSWGDGELLWWDQFGTPVDGVNLMTRYPDKGFLGFGGVDNVKFRGVVVPGQRIGMLGRMLEMRPRRCKAATQGFVDGRLVYEGVITGMWL